jgi:hypothetical protein
MIKLHDRYQPGYSAAVNFRLRGFSVLQREDIPLYTRPNGLGGNVVHAESNQLCGYNIAASEN